mgnify:CR=1 FL=1
MKIAATASRRARRVAEIGFLAGLGFFCSASFRTAARWAASRALRFGFLLRLPFHLGAAQKHCFSLPLFRFRLLRAPSRRRLSSRLSRTTPVRTSWVSSTRRVSPRRGAVQETALDEFVQRSRRSTAFAEFLLGALELHVVAITVGRQKLFLDENPATRGLPGEASLVVVVRESARCFCSTRSALIWERPLAMRWPLSSLQKRLSSAGSISSSRKPCSLRYPPLNLALPSRGDEPDNLLADFARDKLCARQDHSVERLLAAHRASGACGCARSTG